MNTRVAVLAAFSGCFATVASEAQAQTTYLIQPGSTYTYKLGFQTVPDCDLNDDLQCDFTIGGSFSLQESGGTASILDADLTLLNDGPEVPMDPLATSEGVEDWLEARTLELLPAGAPGSIYADTNFSTFLVSVFGDTATLTGGFDFTFVDGNGIDFAVTAVAIPEPAATGLLLSTLTLAGTTRRQRRS